MLIKNIVVFGPPKVGKSTLFGYIFCQYNPGYLEEYILKTKKELGNSYDASRKYGYIGDQAKDERIRTDFSREPKIFSKYVHFAPPIKIDGHEVRIIDTPGAQSKRDREQTKGICLAEIGIFLVELSKLVKKNKSKDSLLNYKNLTTLLDFFTPLNLWLKFRDKTKLVILISKMDEFDFSKDEFNNATEVIKTLCDGINLEIIPICINVDGEKEHNIFSRSEKTPWYTGPILIDKLKEIFNQEPASVIDKPLFVSIEKQFNEIHGIGRVWRGKVLQGTLKKGSSIKMTPIECVNQVVDKASAKVKNIRYEKGDDTEIARKGSIVGIDLHDIECGGGRCKKNYFNSLATSCMVDLNTKVLIGNILQFKILLEEIENINILEIIQIIWFGKLISSQIVDKKVFSDYGLITVELNNIKASMPLDNNRFFFNKFIIKKSNQEFISADLERIGVPYTLTVFLDNIDDKEDKLLNYFSQFKYNINKNELIIICQDGLINLISNIKKFCENEYPEDNYLRTNLEIMEVENI